MSEYNYRVANSDSPEVVHKIKVYGIVTDDDELIELCAEDYLNNTECIWPIDLYVYDDEMNKLLCALVDVVRIPSFNVVKYRRFD